MRYSSLSIRRITRSTARTLVLFFDPTAMNTSFADNVDIIDVSTIGVRKDYEELGDT